MSIPFRPHFRACQKSVSMSLRPPSTFAEFTLSVANVLCVNSARGKQSPTPPFANRHVAEVLTHLDPRMPVTICDTSPC